MSGIAHYLAVDLGASSGRIIQGSIRKNRLHLKELYRFHNRPVAVQDHWYWPVLNLWDGILQGLRKAGKLKNPVSLGMDTWGVDFGLFRSGHLLSAPLAYRDPYTQGMKEWVFNKIQPSTLYRWTGIQFLPFNTLYQVVAMREKRHPVWGLADRLLFMPDLFHYWLSGEAVSEISIASTSQMLNAESRSWESRLFDELEIPLDIMPPLVEPGSVLGPLKREIRESTGLNSTKVVIPAGHDTACAVAGVPAKGGNWAYLSSGTWSLMGVETSSPVLHEGAMKANFTNEAGVNGTTRFLRNSMGLWILQSCIREWSDQGVKHDYETLLNQASESPAFQTWIDPDHPSFLNPRSMTEAIISHCEKTGQPVPSDPGALVRCILESLAFKYRYILDLMVTLGLKKPDQLHIVGGGSRNHLLNQFTADATGLTVLAGPAESTALGNILIQAMALGHLSSLEEARDLSALSFQPEAYTPRMRDLWEEAYQKIRPNLQ